MVFENLLAKQFLKVHFFCLLSLIYFLGDIFVWHEAVTLPSTSSRPFYRCVLSALAFKLKRAVCAGVRKVATCRTPAHTAKM